MNNVNIMLKNVRCHYPEFFRDRTFQEADGSISTQAPGAKFLLDPDEPEHAALIGQIKHAISGICAANNPRKGEDGKGKLLPPDQFALRDGSLTTRDELDGLWFVSANAQKGKPPFVLDPVDPTKRIEHAHEQTKPIYNGCRVNARVRLWWQPQTTGRAARVNAQLVAVQWAGDDEPIGGGVQTTAQAAEGFSPTLDPTEGGHWGGDEEAAEF